MSVRHLGVQMRPAQHVGDTSSLWDVFCLRRSPSRAPFAWELVESVAALGEDWRVQRCCQGVGDVLQEVPECLPVFVEDAPPCGRLPQRQVAELLVRVAPRLVPYPFEATLRHQRGHVVIPHACHLGLHSRRVLVALPFDELQRLF